MPVIDHVDTQEISLGLPLGASVMSVMDKCHAAFECFVFVEKH